MAFCTISNNLDANGYTILKNRFIIDYMPDCNEKQLKVYLYGLYLTNSPFSVDNTIETMSAALNFSHEDIVNAFDYLANIGLVSILSNSPFEVKYNEITNVTFRKHYKTEKYIDFNSQLEKIFQSTTIMPNQLLQYYEFMEDTKITPEVLIMIVKYCVELKGDKIKPNYIIAVARNWINEGVKTISDVENRINKMEVESEGTRSIARAIGKKSEISLDDKDLYIKWTSNWGFGLDAILAAIKTGKIKSTFNKLDNVLDECFRNNALSSQEVIAYLKNKQLLREIAIQVNKNLGLFYESVDFEVEEYISPLLNQGLTSDSLLLITRYCFKSSIRTLEGMNKIAIAFIKEGRLTVDSIHEYLTMKANIDQQIYKFLELCGTTRNVIKSDRDQYKLWQEWGFDDETISYVCTLCQGKSFPMGIVNSNLSKCKNAGVLSLENVKQFLAKNNSTAPTQANFNVGDREYTEDELSSYISTMEDVEDLIK